MPATRLSGLTLSGFQVFADRTHIPLKPLTLMFGPNSSGKSAVSDALRIVFSMFNPTALDVVEQSTPQNSKLYRDRALLDNEFYLLRPHWRRTNASGNPYAPCMEIDVEIECSSRRSLAKDLGAKNYRVGHLSVLTSHQLTQSQSQHAVGFSQDNRHDTYASSKISQTGVPDGADSESTGFDRCHSTLAFEINGSQLISANTSGDVVVNLEHDSRFFAEQRAMFEAACEAYPEYFRIEDGLLIVSSIGGLSLWDFGRPELEFPGAEELAFVREGFVDDELLLSIANRLRKSWGIIATFVHSRFQELQWAFQHVHASRGIPSREELTFLRFPESLGADFGNQKLFRQDGPYASIAFSLASGSRGLERYDRSTHLGKIGRSEKGGGDPGQKVNEWLTGYLFRDRGYRLGFNRWDLEYSTDLEDERKRKDEVRPLLVELLIRDEKGVALEFRQVGSGIGYVFPVLAALAEAPNLAWIEQPELHLHPALQCELGDVVLDAMNEGVGQCIVETHSEHFLLRILRRIRQSCSQKKPVKELRWDPNDLSVLYFEPRMDGSSTVRRLRVDVDGDFLDRWPDGFFSERDKELFDE